VASYLVKIYSSDSNFYNSILFASQQVTIVKKFNPKLSISLRDEEGLENQDRLRKNSKTNFFLPIF
jgi:hypothetical protein